MTPTAVSIDQNCHPLWDVVPKLHALCAKGYRVRHLIEDVDMAFSAPGAQVDTPDLRLSLERYHHSGGTDWGAALFYSEFLGRVPVDIRTWEPLTGMSTSALAKRLGRSVDDLYDAFSPGDNWQLIGSSYVADRRHHRTIADLPVAEVEDFCRRLVRLAKADTLRRFADAAAQQRAVQWFTAEQDRLERLLERHADARLVDVYRHWLASWVDEHVQLDWSSTLFATGGDAQRTALLDYFVCDYAEATRLYNEALAETDSELRPLDVEAGELPLFAVFTHRGHQVRSGVALAGGKLHIGDRSFPLADGRLPVSRLRQEGVVALAGKAVLLTIQARLGADGAPLALPYRGSLYMPASHRLGEKLLARRGVSSVADELLPERLAPVLRVRLRLLDRLGELETPVRLPEHLAQWFGQDAVPAAGLAAHWRDAADEARSRLDAFRSEDGRCAWQREACGEIVEDIASLDTLRRRLAQEDPKQPRIREVSHQITSLEAKLTERTLRRIDADTQLAELDYWDSRGAILPWCVALGGEAFYRRLVEQAEIYTETSQPH
ncbi:MAG: hypothetical protein KGY99_05250 [Phycisphaerae bacterium]|nr:hypothetical protein [Phycisphaerae bacterium]